VTLTQIAIFGLFSLAVGWLKQPRGRGLLLLGASLLAIFWLQPATPIRNLDFWFPTTSIFFTILVWMITREKASHQASGWLLQVTPVVGILLILALTRYLGPLCCLTATRPPVIQQVLAVLLILMTILTLTQSIHRPSLLAGIALFLLIAIFIILKTDTLAQTLSGILRQIEGQDASLAAAIDLRWLGFSYLAFRLLHVLRDFQLGKAHNFSLSEFTIYTLFFPTLTAGPIDRSQRFMSDLRSSPALTSGALLDGGKRILLGVFKKFVLADSLAIISLSPQNAPQVTSSGWLWALLYAYSFRIYFDFSGYTDIALGLGRWMGFRLPENFTAPYLKTNLTAFWNSWHITLAQWFRAYFFNPVTRALRSSSLQLTVWLIILAGQAGTMLLIGLWHGVTWNFAAWGLWHAAGLFIHNRWSEWLRPRLSGVEERPGLFLALKLASWLLTFHYITLGWVWFALPDLSLSLHVIKKLFGL